MVVDVAAVQAVSHVIQKNNQEMCDQVMAHFFTLNENWIIRNESIKMVHPIIK